MLAPLFAMMGGASAPDPAPPPIGPIGPSGPIAGRRPRIGGRRPRIARLFDHTVTVWRPVRVLGPFRVREDVLTPIATFRVAVNRPTARLGDPGPGLTTTGERMVYAEPSRDLRPRDVLELTAGPESGLRVEIDETPTNVRGHHLEARARLWSGQLPTELPAAGGS